MSAKSCLRCGRELHRKVYGGQLETLRKENPSEFAKRKYCDIRCAKVPVRRCLHDVVKGESCLFCDRVNRVAS